VHPLLLAACAVIGLFAASVGETALGDIWLPLAISVGVAGLLTVGGRLVAGSWQRGAIIASLAVAMLFSFQSIYRAIYIGAGLLNLPWLNFGGYLAIWSLALVAGMCLLLRYPRSTQAATRILNLFALLLLAIAAGSAVRPLSRLWAAGQGGDEGPLALRAQADSPDIYYLVFDRYANLATLERDFDFDNRPFYEQLRQRGFHCAENSHANYPRTKISMASALNMRLLHDAVYVDHVGLLSRHRVGRALRAAGYDYYHLGNWYGPLRRNRDATFNWPVSSYPSYFAQELCRATPVVALMQLARGQPLSHVPELESPAAVEGRFNSIEEFAGRRGHKFIYAHFLLPHPPFVFNADGTLATPEQRAGRTHEESYVQQLRYANRRIIKLIDAIAARSQRPPIIVIQADEGPTLIPSDHGKSRVQKISKRTGIISAFRLPDRDAAALVPDDITPVNTFRLIFSSYFGANLQPLPNRVFYWDHADGAGIPDSSKFVRAIDVTDELPRFAGVRAEE
jgi:hypothetical protein